MKGKGTLQVQLTVERHDCPVANAVADSGSNYRVSRVNAGENSSKHLVEFSNYEQGTANRIRREAIKVSKIDEKRLWVDCRSCSSCSLISNSDCIIVSAKPLATELVSYRILLPSEEGLNELMEAMKEAGMSAEIAERTDYEIPDPLTERQTEILLWAYNRGYFDIDRKITLTKLAKEIGVKPSSLEDVLRRGLKKVVEHYISNEF